MMNLLKNAAFGVGLMGLGAGLSLGQGMEEIRAEVLAERAESAGGSFLPKPTEVEAGGGHVAADLERIDKNLKVGGKAMPFVFLKKGEMPEGGWPLFINLHGGGGNPRAAGPHAWEVNTREWKAQAYLFEEVYEVSGLAFIPRMADDREGRWYFTYVQEAIDKVIEDAIQHHGVNPNRVYLTGISEGGYAGFRLASLMADRFAGSCAMAAAEPLGNAPAENLRNVAFRCAIGEKDTTFDRIGLARTYFERLEALKKGDPKGYDFSFDPQKGRGHGIDYREGPKWIFKYTRNPVPKAVVWTVIKQHGISRKRMNWLAIDGDPGSLPLKLRAEVAEDNLIKVSAERADGTKLKGLKLRIYLPHQHLDLKKPVKIQVNGAEPIETEFAADPAVARKSLSERGDPAQIFFDEIVINL